MKKLSLLYSFAILCSLVRVCHAQDAPTTRAEVKAEARAAEKAQTIPRGDASLDMNRDTSRSTANRATVKAATKVAEKTGQIPTGQASLNEGRDTSKSTASRAVIKQQTKLAEKNGQIPRGEAQVRQ